jgi:hypothetical protein
LPCCLATSSARRTRCSWCACGCQKVSDDCMQRRVLVCQSNMHIIKKCTHPCSHTLEPWHASRSSTILGPTSCRLMTGVCHHTAAWCHRYAVYLPRKGVGSSARPLQPHASCTTLNRNWL